MAIEVQESFLSNTPLMIDDELDVCICIYNFPKHRLYDMIIVWSGLNAC